MESNNLDDSFLNNSFYCRLCAEYCENSTLIFADQDEQSLSHVINRYLPIRVENDGKYPKIICPGCSIQLEATKLFLDLIIKGQERLKGIYINLISNNKKRELRKKQLEDALKNINPSSSVNTYEIQSDETGERFFIQICSDGPLFPPDHEIVQKFKQSEDQPKKKRGRPAKISQKEEIKENVKQDVVINDIIGPDGKVRRHRKLPSRYREAVQGEELEKIFINEGLLEQDEVFLDSDKEPIKQTDEVIGRVESKEGVNLGEIVEINNKNSETYRNSGIKRRYRCKTCMTFYIGDYDKHVAVCTGQALENPTENKKPQSNSPESPKNAELKARPKVNNEKDDKKIQSFSCALCLETFNSLPELKTHQPTHRKKSTWPCNQCKRIFKHHSSLLYHKTAEHNNGRKFVCTKCGKSFKHRQLLTRHQNVHNNKRPYKCTECTAAFKGKNHLKTHLLTHSGRKDFVCKECGQAFKHQTSLVLHQRWHNGDKPHVCDLCSKAFSQRGNLVEHRRIHTGEKPFACTECDKKFTTSSQFKLHMKRHNTSMDFVCSFCNMQFKYRDTWLSHLRKHLNEFPYKCDACNKGFTLLSGYKKHKKLHTGLKDYKCKVCQKEFSDFSNCQKHEKAHFKKKLPKILQKAVPKGEPATSIIASTEVENTQILQDYQLNESSDLSIIKNELIKHNSIEIMPDEQIYNAPSDLDENLEFTISSMEQETTSVLVQQIIDQEGNPITLATTDGQIIKVISRVDENGQENIEGLLPDGTLVPISLPDNKIINVDEHLMPKTSLQEELITGPDLGPNKSNLEEAQHLNKIFSNQIEFLDIDVALNAPFLSIN